MIAGITLDDFARMVGGAEGDRTPDLRIANATLSQLSYGPIYLAPATPFPGGRTMGIGQLAVKRGPWRSFPLPLSRPQRALRPPAEEQQRTPALAAVAGSG